MFLGYFVTAYARNFTVVILFHGVLAGMTRCHGSKKEKRDIFVLGAAGGLAQVTATSLIPLWFSEKTIGKATGTGHFAISLGVIASSYGTEIVLNGTGLKYTLIITACWEGAALLFGVLIFKLPPSKVSHASKDDTSQSIAIDDVNPKGTDSTQPKEKVRLRDLKSKPEFWLCLVACLFISPGFLARMQISFVNM